MARLDGLAWRRRKLETLASNVRLRYGLRGVIPVRTTHPASLRTDSSKTPPGPAIVETLFFFSPPLGFFVAFETFDTFIHLRVTMKTTKMP